MLQFIKNFLSLQSRHWPARTEKSLIINAPTWFSYVFALIRPLLNQRQRDKVSDTEGRKPAWIDVISPR